MWFVERLPLVATSTLKELLSDSSQEHQKGKIYSLALGLGTQLTSIGYSTEYLSNTISMLKKTGKPFADRLGDIVIACDGRVHEYDVTFATNWPGPKSAIETFGITFHDAPISIIEEGQSLREFYRSLAGTVYATVRVSALDPYSALSIASERLSHAIAILKQYRQKAGANIKGQKALIKHPNGTLKVYTVNSMPTYYTDSSNIEKAFSRAIAAHSKLEQEDQEQLLAAIHYHHLSLEADTEESRLINLWIALEAITKNGSGSNIERICQLVPAAISMRNPQRVLLNMARDIMRVSHEDDRAEFFKVCSQSSGSSLDPLDLIQALTDSKDGPIISKLYPLVGKHALMCFRIHRYRKGCFANNDKLKSMVASNKRNIDWQLRRIYRARNDHIHRGRACLIGRHLLQHLHSYFNTYLNTLIGTLCHRSKWSLLDAAEYNLWLSSLFNRTGKQSVITNDQIVHPYKIGTV